MPLYEGNPADIYCLIWKLMADQAILRVTKHTLFIKKPEQHPLFLPRKMSVHFSNWLAAFGGFPSQPWPSRRKENMPDQSTISGRYIDILERYETARSTRNSPDEWYPLFHMDNMWIKVKDVFLKNGEPLPDGLMQQLKLKLRCDESTIMYDTKSRLAKEKKSALCEQLDKQFQASSNTEKVPNYVKENRTTRKATVSDIVACLKSFKFKGLALKGRKIQLIQLLAEKLGHCKFGKETEKLWRLDATIPYENE